MKAFWLVLATAAGCLADQVVTRSGDLINGSVLSERDGYVVIRDAGGVEVVPGNAVVRISRSGEPLRTGDIPGIPARVARNDKTVLSGLIIGDNGMYTVVAEGARPGDTLFTRIRVVPAQTVVSRTLLHEPDRFPVRLTGRSVNTGLVRDGRDAPVPFGMPPEPGDLFTTYAGGMLEMVTADGSGLLLDENSDLLFSGYDGDVLRLTLQRGTVTVRTGTTVVAGKVVTEVTVGALIGRPAAKTLARLTVMAGTGATMVSVAEGQCGILQPDKPDMEVVCEAGSRISASAAAPGPLEYGTLEQSDLDLLQERAIRLRGVRLSRDASLFTPDRGQRIGRVFGFISTPRGRLIVGLGALAVYGLFYVSTYVIAK